MLSSLHIYLLTHLLPDSPIYFFQNRVEGIVTLSTNDSRTWYGGACGYAGQIDGSLETVIKEFRRKTTSPSCHPSRRRM